MNCLSLPHTPASTYLVVKNSIVGMTSCVSVHAFAYVESIYSGCTKVYEVTDQNIGLNNDAFILLCSFRSLAFDSPRVDTYSG